jgi:streptomycin 6-kinase
MTADTFEGFLAATRDRIGADAEAWTRDAGDLFDEVTARWELDLGDDALDATGYAVSAVRAGERPVTLRLAYPDGWFHDEVAALVHWNGEGVVELIDHDPRGAMLLARPVPGDDLRGHDDEDEALGLAAGVLERVWIPDPGGLRTVVEEVGEWLRTMPGRHHLAGTPFDRDLLHEATGLGRDLLTTSTERVLLHGDLDLGNVRRASDGFVAVDPKPLVGERTVDATALIRDSPGALAADPVAGAARVQHRFDVLADRLSLDRARLQMWSLVILVDYTLWDFESGARRSGQQRLKVTEMVRAIRV